MSDSKEFILQKTFFLLLTKGYDAVSISDIQNETGMSRGLLYHYFGNKEELFRIAGETFLKDFFLIDPQETSRFGLIDMINYIVGRYKDIYNNLSKYSDTSKISIANYDFLVYQMIEKEERISKMYNQMRKIEVLAWKESAQISLDKKQIRNVLDIDKIARHFITLLDGVWLQAVEEGSVKKHLLNTKQVLMDYYNLLKI